MTAPEVSTLQVFIEQAYRYSAETRTKMVHSHETRKMIDLAVRKIWNKVDDVIAVSGVVHLYDAGDPPEHDTLYYSPSLRLISFYGKTVSEEDSDEEQTPVPVTTETGKDGLPLWQTLHGEPCKFWPGRLVIPV
jgi:hypothetical protein